MEGFVFDTYVKAKDGHTMHFDVITAENDLEKAIAYGKEWLKSIDEDGATMTTKECRFCHSQNVAKEVEDAIKEGGYFIQKMDGC